MRALTIRSTGPIAAGRHLGYKSLAQMPTHRNGPVSSNVRPHSSYACSLWHRREKAIKPGHCCNHEIADMGHILFILLHLIALIFFIWALLLTIPLHLIYAAVSRKPSEKRILIPGPGDIAAGHVLQVNCPECRELIRVDAKKCKHCGVTVTPVAQST